MGDFPVIDSVAVVGCGTMGVGIAIVAARGGCRTLLYDSDAGRIGKARDAAAQFFTRSVELKRMDERAAAAALDRLVPAPALEEMAGAELVIEAVFEDYQVKSELIARLDSICAPETMLATNTSTLLVTQLAAACTQPERFVGLHFCLPAQLMKLVEVTPGLRTTPQVLAGAIAFCEQVGQIPIQTSDTPGFILNRFAIPLHNRAIRMIEENVASAEDIDRAVKSAYGHSMGPLELVDLVGLDTQLRLSEAFYQTTLDPDLACPNLLRQMVAAGWLGKKAGRGFYQYGDDRIFGA